MDVDVTDSQDQEQVKQEAKEHPCDKCPRMFSTSKLLYFHKTRSHGDPVGCDICQKVLKNKASLSHHMRNVHEPSKFTCSLCGKGLKTLRNLKFHETMCGSFRRNKGHIPCHVCHKTYSNEDNLQAHVEKAHVITSRTGTFSITHQPLIQKKPSQDIDCLICKKTFRKRIYLNRHMKVVHEAEQEEDEIFVIKKIKNDKVLLDRMKVDLNANSFPWLLCSKCPQQFKTHKGLHNHQETYHKGQKPFRCSFCLASFETDYLVKRHTARVHSHKKFSCEYCDKTFKLEQILKIHVKRHLNPPKLRKQKSNEEIQRKQLRRRAIQDVEDFIQKMKKYPLTDQRSMVKTFIKLNPMNLNLFDNMMQNPLTEGDVVEMLVDNSLPDLVMLNVLKKLRQKWGMKIVVKNIRRKLIERKQIFEPYFEYKLLDSEVNFKEKCTTGDGDVLPRYVTYCTDLKSVVSILQQKIKDFSTDNYICVLAIDGGKSNLKLCLNFSKKTKDNGKWKLYGPKHSLVLASVCEVPESYNNVKVLLDLVNVDDFDFVLSTDLKLVNIICGKQTNSSKYPCCYGDCYKNESGNWVKGEKMTTFEDLRNCFQDYEKNGNKNRKKLMNFKNCEFDPLLHLSTCVLFAIPPQVLHGVLLATNKIVEDIDKVKKQLIEMFGDNCDDEIKNFCIFSEINRLYIVREGYQGKTYEGKQCRDILKNIENFKFPMVFNPFVTALKAHRNLVKLCYKEELPSNYKEVINQLKSAYNVLVVKFGVTINNKMHIIFDHLEDYFDHTKLSLVKTADELIENMHQFVHKRLLRSGYKVKDLLNPNHGLNLYRAILHINAYNVVFDNESDEIDDNIDQD